MDLSSAKGIAICVKRVRVLRPGTTPKKTGDVIDAAATAIRDARIRAGLTQEKAAGLRGHATSTISRWESGGLPQTWEQLDQYAKALGQPIVLRFGHKEESLPQSLDWGRLMERVDAIAEAVDARSPEERLLDAVDDGSGPTPAGGAAPAAGGGRAPVPEQ